MEKNRSIKKRSTKKDNKKRYYKKNNKMKGGMKKKNTNLTFWDAVRKMINVKGAILTKISESSLSGFIFRLNVPEDPENSEFFSLNDDKTKFSKPIYSLIFKIVIIGHEELPEYTFQDSEGIQEVSKQCETIDDFEKEAKIQQDIYLNTLKPNGSNISPSIIDFSLFDGKNSETLLYDLSDLVKRNDSGTRNMIIYLSNTIRDINEHSEKIGLGMITMELVDNKKYDQLYKFSNEPSIYNKSCCYAIAEIIVLFLNLKIINYDCHSGNVLSSDSGKSFLIDFGRTVNANSITEPIKRYYERFSGRKFENDLTELKNIDKTRFFIENQRGDDKTRKEWLIEIIRFIALVDFSTNVSIYKEEIVSPQMISLLENIFDNMPSNWVRYIKKGNQYDIINRIKNINWDSISDDTCDLIISNIISITKDPIVARSNTSLRTIDNDINLFRFDNNNSYYRNLNDIDLDDEECDEVCDDKNANCCTKIIKSIKNLTRKNSKKDV
jgi:hypothetical protein